MGRLMKRLAIVIIIVLISVYSHAATYYVKAGGDDGASGLSDADAWATIGKINSFDFADGDIIQFNRGDTFNDTHLFLTSTTTATAKTIRIQGYGAGDLPWVGGSQRYISIVKDSNLSVAIRNINASGQNMGTHQGAKINLRHLNNVTVENVYADGSVAYYDNGYGGCSGLTVRNSHGDVLIENNEIFNWGEDGLWADDPPSPSGRYNRPAIAVYPKYEGTLIIRNNAIHSIASDGIILENVRVALDVSGNTIWNCGENAIDLKGVGGAGYTSEIKHNKFYRHENFTGISGSSWEGSPQALIQVLNWSSGPSAYLHIHNNELGPTDGLNFSIGTTGGGGVANVADINNNITFRDNTCGKARIHFRSNNGTGNQDQLAYAQINDNWFEGLHEDGLFVRILNRNTNGTQFNRNVFISENLTSVESISDGFVQLSRTRSVWKDNIFHVNHPMSSAGATIAVRYAESNPTFEGNFYYNYNTNPAYVIDYLGTKYSIDDQALWIAEGNPGEVFSTAPYDSLDAGVGEPDNGSAGQAGDGHGTSGSDSDLSPASAGGDSGPPMAGQSVDGMSGCACMIGSPTCGNRSRLPFGLLMVVGVIGYLLLARRFWRRPPVSG